MKKIIIVILMLIMFSGCSYYISEPTKKVVEFLNKYQTLDKDVELELNDFLETEEDYTEEILIDYKNVYEKQYKDLMYEIKEEQIDGINAYINVQIEVYDYYKINKECYEYFKNNPKQFTVGDDINLQKYSEYKINKLLNAKERIVYTIKIELTKVEDEWLVDPLSDEAIQKIHGTYNY